MSISGDPHYLRSLSEHYLRSLSELTGLGPSLHRMPDAAWRQAAVCHARYKHGPQRRSILRSSRHHSYRRHMSSTPYYSYLRNRRPRPPRCHLKKPTYSHAEARTLALEIAPALAGREGGREQPQMPPPSTCRPRRATAEPPYVPTASLGLALRGATVRASPKAVCDQGRTGVRHV